MNTKHTSIISSKTKISRSFLKRSLITLTLIASTTFTQAWIGTHRVNETSTDGVTVQGDPMTVTWSIVPDGTFVFHSSALDADLYSNFIAHMDANFSVPVADQDPDDLTQRPWFTPLKESFDAFAIKSGITYVYVHENNIAADSDTGTDLEPHAPGIPGKRGDSRICGTPTQGYLALSFGGPSSNSDLHGNVVFKTTDRSWNTGTLESICSHENMHSVGFHHAFVSGGGTLSFYSSNGPQFDDLLGLHHNYGDFNEKSGGNDTVSTATDLGSLSTGGYLGVGLDLNEGDTYTTIAPTDVDFVSIDSNTDTDVFKFSLTQGQNVILKVSPRGYDYDWDVNTSYRYNISAKVHSNLSFRVLDASGNELYDVSNAAIGLNESVQPFLSAGDYYVEVRGSSVLEFGFNEIPTQFYALEVSTAPVAYAQSIKVAKNSFKEITLTSSLSSSSFIVDTQPSHGTLSGTAPDLIYTPDADYQGADSFTFYVSDSGLDSAPVTVNIDVVDFADFVTINRVSTQTGYDITEAETIAFRSTSVAKTYDPDYDDAYGTEGYVFFSTGSGTGSEGFENIVSDGATWLSSIDSGADYNNSVQFGAYHDFDNPTAGISPDVSDWAITGYARSDTGDASTWAELVTFTVDENAPELFRVGVFAGNNNGATIDPSGIRLSVSGSTPVEATGLNTDMGMVFYDISIQDGVTPTFSLEAQRNGADRQTAIAGITFDLITATGYDEWTIGNPTLNDTSPSGDPDNDGISNLLEYVLNGDPTSAGDDILPKAEVNGNNFIFSFTRLASSAEDTTQVFQYTSTIESDDWTDINITEPQHLEVAIGNEVNGLEPVTITISKDVEIDKKLFGRLKVTKP